MRLRPGAIRSGVFLAIALLVAACSGSAATLAPASASTTPRPPVTPAGLPNLTSAAPVVTPAGPTCGVSFNVAAVVRNEGLGPSLGDARVGVWARRTTDGWGNFKEYQDIPPLPAGSSARISLDVTITRAGTYELYVEADTNMWVPETNEADNVASRTITVARGTCGTE